MLNISTKEINVSLNWRKYPYTDKDFTFVYMRDVLSGIHSYTDASIEDGENTIYCTRFYKVYDFIRNRLSISQLRDQRDPVESSTYKNKDYTFLRQL